MEWEIPEKRPAAVGLKSNFSSNVSSKHEQRFSRPSERPKPQRNHTHHSIEINTYFQGPRDPYRHSKWPFFLRLHGSVLPKMILPLIVVAGWTTLITCISELISDLGIDSVLLTVLGFVVALALSFRSSSAYERYSEGRKYWAQLMLESRNLSRLIWINTPERHNDPKTGKADLINKISALNLIHAFSLALKYRLRFEPAMDFPDIHPLISHLHTFSSLAEQHTLHPKPETPWHSFGSYLGLSFSTSNPRKLLKKSADNLGNLPLEILNYLAAYTESLVQNNLLTSTAYQGTVFNSLNTLTSILSGTERITSTPLPTAYSIAIAQITWIYVLALPFQLLPMLNWITIPATLVAATIILGLASIGREIENPFGNDVNDLPLDTYCRELAADIDLLVSKPPGDFAAEFLAVDAWDGMSVEEIRRRLRERSKVGSGHASRALSTRTAEYV
jgi:putative membrane protein